MEKGAEEIKRAIQRAATTLVFTQEVPTRNQNDSLTILMPL